MTIIRTFGEIFGRQSPALTVTREAGARSCVLSGIKNGREIERVTAASPQAIIDYLDSIYPGEIVRWRLMPKNAAGTAASTGGLGGGVIMSVISNPPDFTAAIALFVLLTMICLIWRTP